MKRTAKKIKNEKAKLIGMSFVQIFTMIVSIFAFAFIIGGMTVFSTEKVEAADSYIPQGCCKQGIDGSKCQNMVQSDAGLCNGTLISTDCAFVSDCQPGCCYNAFQGTCSLNSPKSLCTSLGGVWDKSTTCNIQQCQLGCCILGQEAQLTTPRECTIKSEQFGFERNFQALDSDGTCNSKTNLDAEGACVIPSPDYSGLNDCKFTTKKQCAGDFYENILCTSKNLSTSCSPSKQTTCLDGDDKIYFLDSCGNKANIYDADKSNQQSYWEKILPQNEICSSASASCGNCDYLKGTRCDAYNSVGDAKPTLGNNVCKNLNCINGRKHGESWCVADYNKTTTPGVAPVGSRFFLGSCVEGEIAVTPCADFNQEICVQGQVTQNNATFTEAKCQTNDWRTCLAANGKSTYSEVETECKKYPQCTMFLNIDNPIIKAAQGLAGFKKGVDNIAQGNADGIGNSMNKGMVHCVPKNTPGMVFWSDYISAGDARNPTAAVQRGIDYGGSLGETKAICSLGSFTCVTKKTKTATGTSWTNKECMQTSGAWVDALNERCQMVGPCAMKINVAGELGQNTTKMSQIHINSKGKASAPYPIYMTPSQKLLDFLKTSPGLIKAGTLNKITAAAISILTGRATYSALPTQDTAGDATSASQQAQQESQGGQPMDMMTSAGLGAMAIYGVHYAAMASLTASTASAGSSLSAIGWAAGVVALAAVAGYMIGQLFGGIFGLSPGQTQALSYSLAAGAATAAILYSTSVGTAVGVGGAISAELPALGGLGWCLICVAIIIAIMVLTYIFTYEEVEYWITTYECQPWQAPSIGDCQLCNNDVRPCSDYRCRSLGQNCNYFTDNGEPGFCSDSQDIWSAKIKPWQEALTGENEYTKVTDTSFSIQGKTSDKKVEAWQTLQFGIITDKPATCKIDNKHTKSYNEMSITMSSQDALGCLSGSCGSQATNHKVALSPNINSLSTIFDTATLSMKPGENDYYIRCRNFAGQTNEAEFAVKVIVGEGPDLTAPIITGFIPSSGTYVKKGTNTTLVKIYVNEPSTCKYSSVDNEYNKMESNATCNNDDNEVYLGNYPCYATLNNLSENGNKFYFKCKDQPNLNTTADSILQQNTAKNSKEYQVNVCQTGLNITSITPNDKVISGTSPVSLTMKVNTQGCISNGKSICAYRFKNSDSETLESIKTASDFIDFYNTDSTTHTQVFSDMPEGNSDIQIKCTDEAGNIAFGETNLQIELDNSAPSVIKVYNKDSNLAIITNEDSQCKYTTNSSIGCSFDFASTLNENENIKTMSGITTLHTIGFTPNKNYYIKCQDSYGNTNGLCAIVVRTY